MWNIFEHALRCFIIDNNDKLLITFQQVSVYLNEPTKIHELIKLANQSNDSQISCDYDQISKSKAHL